MVRCLGEIRTYLHDHHPGFVNMVKLVVFVLDHFTCERQNLAVLVDELVEILLGRYRHEHDAIHQAVGFGADAVVLWDLHSCKFWTFLL